MSNQLIRPTGTILAEDTYALENVALVGAATFHGAVNEAVADGDSSYILLFPSDKTPPSRLSDILFNLPTVIDPKSTTGWKIRLLIKVVAGDVQEYIIVIRLFDRPIVTGVPDGNEYFKKLARFTPTVIPELAYRLLEFDITDAEARTVDNFDQLRVEIFFTLPSGKPRFNITQIEQEFPAPIGAWLALDKHSLPAPAPTPAWTPAIGPPGLWLPAPGVSGTWAVVAPPGGVWAPASVAPASVWDAVPAVGTVPFIKLPTPIGTWANRTPPGAAPWIAAPVAGGIWPKLTDPGQAWLPISLPSNTWTKVPDPEVC